MSICQTFLLFAYQENCWNLSEVGQSRLFPFADASCADKLLFRGQSSRNAEARFRVAGTANVGKEFGVAIRRLDKQLRLVFIDGTRFQLFETLAAGTAVDGQIAVESKALSVESRGHDRQQDGRRANERNHAEPLALCDGHHIGSGIGNSRTPRFTDDPPQIRLF